MPEGHTLHRLARQQTDLLAGRRVRASSPQGRFSDGAQQVNGRELVRVEAYGKHLFQRYAGLAAVVHVHLGLYGTFTIGAQPAPPPRGALRLRVETDEVWIDLRGPITCELLDPPGVDAVLARLGPDPLRRGSRGEAGYERLRRSRVPLGAALMDQAVVAGVGNVYRAELLFRHRRDPFRPARELSAEQWQLMWSDLVRLMRAGVRAGGIVTTLPQHRATARRVVPREDAHYVYRRAGLPCRVCGTEVRTAPMVGRNLFWCPRCQID